MFVTELTRAQLDELKGRYVAEIAEKWGFYPSYNDMAQVASTTPDSYLFHHYEGIAFTNDDFLCTAGF